MDEVKINQMALKTKLSKYILFLFFTKGSPFILSFFSQYDISKSSSKFVVPHRLFSLY